MDPTRRQERRSDALPQAATSSNQRLRHGPRPSSTSVNRKFYRPFSSFLIIFSVGRPISHFSLLETPSRLSLPFQPITKFNDVTTDIDVDHMAHYQSGEVPSHLTLLYEPKVIKVGSRRHLVQFRYCHESGRFRWRMLKRPLVRRAINVTVGPLSRPTPHPNLPSFHTIDLTQINLDLDEKVVIGREDGEDVWTTRMCLMEDVLHWLKYYDLTEDGRIYAAVPGRIPIFTFGRLGLPFPPLSGNFYFINSVGQP